MDIKVFDVVDDTVINSYVASGKTNYRFALESLIPLINRFDAQRKLQDRKFYKRLQRDIIVGCLMPPITIAFVDISSKDLSKIKDFEKYVNENIKKAYILDGMQRLHTLLAASEDDEFNDDRPLYVNIIVAPTQDKLLYRMITLNNGQKPMTPRHQIEILTEEIFDFDHLKYIKVQTEKARASKIIPGAFNVGDIAKGYLAFLTNNVHNENNKIIDEKMDEILVGRILDSKDIDDDLTFEKILQLIDSLSAEPEVRNWFKVTNNLIGFCVGVRESYEIMELMTPEEYLETIQLFEIAFSAINPSKVNLGKYRRMLSRKFIEEFQVLSGMDADDLTEVFAEHVLT